MDLIRPHLKGPHLFVTAQWITPGYQLCARNNPKTEGIPFEREVPYAGVCLYEDWQVDFTQTPRIQRNFNFFQGG